MTHLFNSFGKARLVTLALLLCGPAACHGLLDVDPPANVKSEDQLGSASAAQKMYVGAKSDLSSTWQQYLADVSLFSDEFTQSAGAYGVNTGDARIAGPLSSPTAPSWLNALGLLFNTRSELLLAKEKLAAYDPTSSQFGEALALIGYIELELAEDYCAGVPLDSIVAGGGIGPGTPLTTDSLFAVAEARFESALVHANGAANVIGLASVGLGRVRLDRGHYDAADSAVMAVPTTFVFTFRGQDNFLNYCGGADISDREGGNGLNFATANDPRLPITTAMINECGTTSMLTYSVRFGPRKGTLVFQLASGVEARLIQAEAALQRGSVTVWGDALNSLRANAGSTFLALPAAIPALTADSTTNATDSVRIDVMFRERAFWLFGSGIRAGDMRRLLRLYDRRIADIYPTGPYQEGRVPIIPVYGDAVTLALPDPASGAIRNPNYRGCTTPANQP